jgi:hypothetical protein
MKNNLNLITGIEVGEPLFLRNLTLFPLTNGGKDFTRIEILSEAKGKKLVEIRELETPKIDTVLIKNNSAKRIFALDGEGIQGALQDRVINSSALIAEKTEVEIPVSCVEAGRWSGGEEFFSQRAISYPSLRAIICSSVTSSLYRTKKFTSNQNQIWDSIKKKMERFKVNSRTSSIHDLYSSRQKYLASYKEGIKSLKNLNGLFVFCGERLLCLDLFGSKSLFNKLKEQLITSYALDALEGESSSPPGINRIKRLLIGIKEAEMRTFPSFSLGEEIRFETDELTGRGLVFQDSLIHLSAFPKS